MDRFGLRERWSRPVHQPQVPGRNRPRQCRIEESPPPAPVAEALAVDPFVGEQGLPAEVCARCTPMSLPRNTR
jgi:hypothetical protein